MRINRLAVRNFKGFESREFTFHPEFNLVVGVNGTGKSSLLDALSIAAGSWFLGIRGNASRHIRPQEVSLADFEVEDIDDSGKRSFHYNWEPQYPCSVSATGEVVGNAISWCRTLNTPGGRTTYGDARSIKDLASAVARQVASGGDVVLPLISYYGTGRLWDVPRDQARVKNEREVSTKQKMSRLVGYRNSVDPRLSVADLVQWIARQSWITFQQGGQSPPILDSVINAIRNCIDGAQSVYFDPRVGEVIAYIQDQGQQPFNNLSDGQRCMLALVGDIAQKAATLNPQLGVNALIETPGVVLIDELDLHLHPKWQRRVIEDLRTTFPRIQFVCTTHSPFLIQSLRSGEELITLDGQPTAQLSNLSLEEIAQGIMGVTRPNVSERYGAMKETARNYLETLEEASIAPRDKLAAYEEKLAEAVAPYADNPAFQAFLEMKRASKLGE